MAKEMMHLGRNKEWAWAEMNHWINLRVQMSVPQNKLPFWINSSVAAKANCEILNGNCQ